MRGGGISDEDPLNRPFPFALVVNNPNESDTYNAQSCWIDCQALRSPAGLGLY